tara:strand:- start:1586 stop:2014 length:429 start_codon:yes stop_codon:yes gene_type:complete
MSILSTTIAAAITAVAPPKDAPAIDHALYAMRIVESNNNPDAVGDRGKAIGIYQVWRIYWTDAIEYTPSIGGEYKDCFNPEYAEQIVRSYMRRYCNKRRLGHEPTIRDYCIIHNGGPNAHKATGQKKKNLDKYWAKCKEVLK